MAEYPNIRVMYVDDEADNLFVFNANFRRKFEIVTKISASDALLELDAVDSQIQVVISDMRMPEMNGINFIKRAKEKHQHISYFILTGYGHSAEIQDAVAQQVISKCFTKPFDVVDIENTILRAVQADPLS
jgi:DNA-binding NtrC family response regulator